MYLSNTLHTIFTSSVRIFVDASWHRFKHCNWKYQWTYQLFKFQLLLIIGHTPSGSSSIYEPIPPEISALNHSYGRISFLLSSSVLAGLTAVLSRCPKTCLSSSAHLSWVWKITQFEPLVSSLGMDNRDCSSETLVMLVRVVSVILN